jgi:hypothetical protein
MNILNYNLMLKEKLVRSCFEHNTEYRFSVWGERTEAYMQPVIRHLYKSIAYEAADG